ncbi:MAG: hypothetical protein HY707_01750 [Ignavibacteriae bacterium]|nr:hypothetical protein [Ignavibacteriota bacterium]
MEETTFSDEESRDINNKKFWDELHQSFQLTIELLHDFAKEHGIDLNAIDYEEEKKKNRERRKKAKENPIAKAANEYSKMVTEWFEQHEGLFEEKQNVLMKQFELNIGNPQAATASVVDAVEVIRWYQDQIWVKLMRALNGEEFDIEMEKDEVVEELPKDSDGSAKVALIGIDRSIGAWGELQKHFADHSDSIVNILIYLSRLRKSIERRFPLARRFVRPGFDQEM